MTKDKEIDSRILLLEQLLLEMIRTKNSFSRRKILNRLKERFVYSKPLLELIRYAELELDLPNRDQVTKYSDFLMHRATLTKAYEDEE